MAAMVEPRRLSGPENLALTLLLLAPAALSLFASYAIRHRWEFSASALWFVYQISFFLGICGAALAAALIVRQLSDRHIPVAFVWLMATATGGAVAIVWYAAHIYSNPWKW